MPPRSIDASDGVHLSMRIDGRPEVSFQLARRPLPAILDSVPPSVGLMILGRGRQGA
jgi:hypothetical protein